MSSKPTLRSFGLGPEEAGALGDDAANRLRVVRALVVLGPRLRAIVDRTLASSGLTTQQAALLTLARAERPTMAHAARVLSTTRQNVKQLADALVRKGFLRVVPDEVDLRATRLTTTAKNDAYWGARDAHDHAAILAVLSDLSPEEAAQLYRLLSRVLDGAERVASEPAVEAPAPARAKGRPPRKART